MRLNMQPRCGSCRSCTYPTKTREGVATLAYRGAGGYGCARRIAGAAWVGGNERYERFKRDKRNKDGDGRVRYSPAGAGVAVGGTTPDEDVGVVSGYRVYAHEAGVPDPVIAKIEEAITARLESL